MDGILGFVVGAVDGQLDAMESREDVEVVLGRWSAA